MRPTNNNIKASGAIFNLLRAEPFPFAGAKRARSTPGVTTWTFSGVAPYNETKAAASASVFAIKAFAFLTICSSPRARISGSSLSPSAKDKFFTFAIVCIVCTNGTPVRSEIIQPSCPEIQ